MERERIRRRTIDCARDINFPLRQDARILGQITARNGVNRSHTCVCLVSDADIVEISRLELSKACIRHKTCRAADGEVPCRFGLQHERTRIVRIGERDIVPVRDAVRHHLHRARARREVCARSKVHGVRLERRVLVARIRERSRELERCARFHRQRCFDIGCADLDVARRRIADLDFARARVDEIEVIHVNIGTRRTDGHRLARRLRLDRDRAVRTRKSTLCSRRKRQRIRLDIDRTACCRYLARRVEIDRRRFE